MYIVCRNCAENCKNPFFCGGLDRTSGLHYHVSTAQFHIKVFCQKNQGFGRIAGPLECPAGIVLQKVNNHILVYLCTASLLHMTILVYFT